MLHMRTDRQALERCAECFDDGEDADIGLAAFDRLVALGWLIRTGRRRWEITDVGRKELGPPHVLQKEKPDVQV